MRARQCAVFHNLPRQTESESESEDSENRVQGVMADAKRKCIGSENEKHDSNEDSYSDMSENEIDNDGEPEQPCEVCVTMLCYGNSLMAL